MNIELPLTVGAALTLVGAAAFAAIAAMWLKKYLPDWRLTGLLVLAIAEAFTFTAQFIAAKGRPDGAQLFSAFLVGLGGATLAVFGYEQVANLLGLVGIGKRSDGALKEGALSSVKEMMASAGQAKLGK